MKPYKCVKNYGQKITWGFILCIVFPRLKSKPQDKIPLQMVHIIHRSDDLWRILSSMETEIQE